MILIEIHQMHHIFHVSKIVGAFGAKNWSIWAIFALILVFLDPKVTPFLQVTPPIEALMIIYNKCTKFLQKQPSFKMNYGLPMRIIIHNYVYFI